METMSGKLSSSSPTVCLLLCFFSSRGVLICSTAIQRDASKIDRIPLSKHVYYFLQQQRGTFLAQLKQQLNLIRVQLIDNLKTTANGQNNNNNNINSTSKASPKKTSNITKEGYFVEVEGHPAKITRLKQELDNITIRYEKVSVQPRQGIPPPAIISIVCLYSPFSLRSHRV